MDRLRRSAPNDNMKAIEATVEAVGAYPAYNEDLRTRRIAVCGLGFTCALSLFTLLTGVALLTKEGSDLPFVATSSAATRELFPIFTTLIVTLCIETVGYIHSSSLRWALVREERLEYNSYLRLFTGARKLGPNYWLVNFGVAIAIVITYMSTSSVFLPDFYTGSPNEYVGTGTRINGVALVTLGLGLGGQALVGVWTMRYYSKAILSWSSNPLNTTLVCLTNGIIHRQPDRCLRGVDSPLDSNAPVTPQARQVRAKAQSFSFSLVFMFIVGIIYLIIGAKFLGDDSSNGFLDDPAEQGIGSSTPLDGASIFKYMLLVACCQIPLTISLHCAEIMVNQKRDEASWRSATSTSGTSFKSSAVQAALKSPLTMYLFFFKAALHWLFGQAVQVQYLNGFGISGVEILVLGNAYLVLFFPFIFAARMNPKGPQPATWGHIQTVANLVDEWGEVIWWGDKGERADGSGIRHAGTSSQAKLPDLDMRKLYQGVDAPL